MGWLARELRMGARMLGRDKAFSLASALTLAVCIGANTALFSVVHNVLLRPLPFPESDRIVLMASHQPRQLRFGRRFPTPPRRWPHRRHQARRRRGAQAHCGRRREGDC